MALSEAKRRSNDRYITAHYQRLAVSYPIKFCDSVRAAASAAGQSLAGYVRQAVEERMRRDGFIPEEQKETAEP